MLPHPLDGVGDVAAGNVEEDKTEHNSQPEKEGHNPVLVIAVQNERGDPPASEEATNDKMGQRTTVTVERSHWSLCEARLGNWVRVRSRDTVCALLIVAVVWGAVDICLVGGHSIVRAVRSGGGVCRRMRMGMVTMAVIVKFGLGRDIRMVD